jgi:hypothetical protein
MYTIVDPKKAVHPLRKKLSDDDWQRITNAILEDIVEDVTIPELDAYADFMYDLTVSKLQTVAGTKVLQ